MSDFGTLEYILEIFELRAVGKPASFSLKSNQDICKQLEEEGLLVYVGISPESGSPSWKINVN